MKKIVVYAKTEREARHLTPTRGENIAYAYRAVHTFDDQNLEACDELIVHGDFPEINRAYEGPEYFPPKKKK